MFGMVPELTEEQKQVAREEQQQTAEREDDREHQDEVKISEDGSETKAKVANDPTSTTSASSSASTSQKPTSDKKKEKEDKKKKKPPTIGELVAISIFGGQVAYYVVHSIYAGVSEAVLGPDLARRLDSLFFVEGTTERKVLDALQLAGRGYMSLALILGTTAGLMLMALVTGGSGFGYFWLSSFNGDAMRLFQGFLRKKRLDILLLFLGGITPGWYYPEIWDSVINPTVLWGGFPFWDALQPVCLTLYSAVIAIWKLADTQQKRKEKEDAKKKEGVLKRGLRNTKVGELEINGEKADDISALDVYEAVTETAADKEKKWEENQEVPANKVARFATGVAYGLCLRFAWEMFSASVVPTLKLVFQGQGGWLTTYFWYGLRAAKGEKGA